MEVVLKTLVSHVHAFHANAILAYIDPSTGSLIFQVLAASAISAGLFVKGLRERMIWLISGGWRTKGPAAPAPSSQESADHTQNTAQESMRKAA
jgi:hypothetical protein